MSQLSKSIIFLYFPKRILQQTGKLHRRCRVVVRNRVAKRHLVVFELKSSTAFIKCINPDFLFSMEFIVGPSEGRTYFIQKKTSSTCKTVHNWHGISIRIAIMQCHAITTLALTQILYGKQVQAYGSLHTVTLPLVLKNKCPWTRKKIR